MRVCASSLTLRGTRRRSPRARRRTSPPGARRGPVSRAGPLQILHVHLDVVAGARDGREAREQERRPPSSQKRGVHGRREAAARVEAAGVLKAHCKAEGVWPYFVPAGGVMCTPPYNMPVETVVDAGRRMEAAFGKTAADMGW